MQAETLALAKVERLAEEAGAKQVEMNVVRDVKHAQIESRDMLIEARILATASGRPPIVS